MAGKKKKGKKQEGKGAGEDTSAHSPSETRSGKQYQPHSNEDEDEQQGTRVPQSGPPIGKFPPLRTSGELQSAERGAEPDRFYHWQDADSERRAYEEDRDEQDTSDEPHTAALREKGNETDLDEEPKWDSHGWVQNESHPTWKDTSSDKREFDSEMLGRV